MIANARHCRMKRTSRIQCRRKAMLGDRDLRDPGEWASQPECRSCHRSVASRSCHNHRCDKDKVDNLPADIDTPQNKPTLFDEATARYIELARRAANLLGSRSSRS